MVNIFNKRNKTKVVGEAKETNLINEILNKVKKNLSTEKLEGTVPLEDKVRNHIYNELATNPNKYNSINFSTEEILNYSDKDDFPIEVQDSIARIYLKKLGDKISKNTSSQKDFDLYFQKKIDSNKPIELIDIKTYVPRIQETINGEINIDISYTDINSFFSKKYDSLNKPVNQPDIQKGMFMSHLIYWKGKEISEKHMENKKETREDVDNISMPNSKIGNIFKEKLNQVRDLRQKQHWKNKNSEKEQAYQDMINIQAKLMNADQEPNNENNNVENNVIELEKNLWNAYIELFEFADLWNNKTARAFRNAVEVNFDFSLLDKRDQDEIVNKTLKEKLRKSLFNQKHRINYLEHFGINEGKFKDFLDELLNFRKEKSEITIPLAQEKGKEFKLSISKRFKEGTNLDRLDITDGIDSMEELPIEFDVNIDQCSPELIKQLEDPTNPIFSEKTARITGKDGHTDNLIGNKDSKFHTIRLKNGENLRINEGYKIDLYGQVGYLRADATSEDFSEEDYKNNPDLLDSEGKFNGNNLFLCDQYGRPIRDKNDTFIIVNNTNPIDESKLKILKKNIELKGAGINSLFMIYFFSNQTSFDHTKEVPKEELPIDLRNRKKEIIGKGGKFDGIFGGKVGIGDKDMNSLMSEQNILRQKQDADSINEAITEFYKEEERKDIKKLGIVVDPDIVRINSNLDDKTRKQEAERILKEVAKKYGKNFKLLSEEQKEAIIQAHWSTRISTEEYDKLDSEQRNNYFEYEYNGEKVYYELGLDGERIAGIWNNMPEQLRKKVEILKNVGFESWQIEALMKYGICAPNPDTIENRKKGRDIANGILKGIKDNDENFVDESGNFVLPVALQERYNGLNQSGKDACKTKIDTLYDDDDIEADIKEQLDQAKERLGQVDDESNSQESANLDLEDDPEIIPEESETEKFDKAWEKLEGGNVKFENGTKIMVNTKDSKIGPTDGVSGGRNSRTTFTICHCNANGFKLIVNTQQGDSTLRGDNIEGQEIGAPGGLPFTKNKSFIDSFQKAGTVYKTPTYDTKDWNKTRSIMESSGILKKYTVLGKAPQQTQFENGVFLKNTLDDKRNKIIEPVKYFLRKPIAGGNEIALYTVNNIGGGKIELRGKKNTEDKGRKKVINYADFILFIENKQLKGYTEKEVEKMKGELKIKGFPEDADPNQGKKMSRFSLGAIRGSLKNGYKGIDEKIKKYREEQIEDFSNILYSNTGFNLYGKLGSLFAMTPFGSFRESFELAEVERNNDQENRIWNKIDKWYKSFTEAPHFSTQWKKRLRKILENPEGEKDKYKVAAALLATTKKDGPYSRELEANLGKGKYINILLGSAHKERYKIMYENKKRLLEENADTQIVHWRQKIKTELMNMEIEYITGVIDGRAPYFGDDEYYWASVWSRKFAEELSNNNREFYNGYDDRLKKAEDMSPEVNKAEFIKNMRNNRPEKGLPNLHARAKKAHSRTERDEIRMYVMGLLLTGTFLNGMTDYDRTTFWKICRSMSFLPGLMVRDTFQQRDIQILLDEVSGKLDGVPPFSKKCGYKMSDFQPGADGQEKRVKEFMIQDEGGTPFVNYREKYGGEIMKVISFSDIKSREIVYDRAKNADPENRYVFKYIIEKSKEHLREEKDEDVANIHGFLSDFPLSVNKGVVSGLLPEQGGKWQGKEVEEEGAKEFWDSVSSPGTIPQEKTTKEDTEFIMGKYFNWFETNILSGENISMIVKGLKTVQNMKENGQESEAKYFLRYLVYGQILENRRGFPPEFTIAIDKFFNFFWANIDNIDSNIINNALYPNGSQYKKEFEEKSYFYLEGDEGKEFYKEYMSVRSTSKDKYQKAFIKKQEEAGKSIDSRDYINFTIDEIDTKLKRANLDIPVQNPYSISI